MEGVEAFRGPIQALFGFSLHVDAGERVALVGRNGVGKTTALRAIAGLSPARRGQIRLHDREISALPAHRIAKLGIALVPDYRGILALTVEENLQLFYQNVGRARRRSSGSARSARIWQLGDVWELFPQLADSKSRRANSLSGGQQQMLSIARAVLGSPELLLLDEPFEGLAPKVIAHITEAVQELSESGIGVIVAEHSKHVLQVADRAYLVRQGMVVQESTPEELLASGEFSSGASPR